MAKRPEAHSILYEQYAQVEAEEVVRLLKSQGVVCVGLRGAEITVEKRNRRDQGAVLVAGSVLNRKEGRTKPPAVIKIELGNPAL